MLDFHDIGTVADLIGGRLPRCDWLRSCGVYRITVDPGYTPEFISPADARSTGNVVSPWRVPCPRAKWVSGAQVVYIGLAGRHKPRPLRERIADLARHAAGRTTPKGPHCGGEIVWQLGGYQSFRVFAAPTADPPAPRDAELALLDTFIKAHGRLPFGNRRR